MEGKKQHTLVDIDEGMEAVLNFIGTEKFYSLAEDISTPIAGFMFGLSYGLILASVSGSKFLYVPKDENNSEEETEDDGQRESEN